MGKLLANDEEYAFATDKGTLQAGMRGELLSSSIVDFKLVHEAEID